MKEKTVEQLNKLYSEAETIDKAIAAEMRSNILLVAGDHYAKRSRQPFTRTRDNRDNDTQKLRLTKNHIYRASRYYKTNLMSYVPGVTVRPQKATDLQDQKSAELNLSVWQDAKVSYRLKEFFRELTADYVDIGEMCCKLYWDPNRGDFQGYQHKMSPDGEPMFDEDGQPIADEEIPVFSGDFYFERIYGYNIKRHPGCDVMKDSPCIIIDKMAQKTAMMAMYGDDPKKRSAIENASSDKFVVFDANTASYGKKDESQVLVKEFYYRPGTDYPNGYYYIVCGDEIMASDELPFGIFPIVWAGFDTFQGSPRGRSMIKVGRPYQAEINRASSAVALHQTTLGDDKIIHQNGTKLAPGALLPGVRGITYQGAPPQILPGRDGGQYMNYIKDQIIEMDRALMISEVDADDQSNLDPYALLFRSMSQHKKFSPYTEKLEQAFMDICFLFLELSRNYLPDDALIRAVGKSEYINIAEFKTTVPLRDMIVVEPQEETIETRLGRQLTFQNILQYVGQQLDPTSIGKLIKNLPFANVEDDFNDMTLDYDSIKNEFLAIERGETPEVNQDDNHDYALTRYSNRKKQGDFKLLHPAIQNMYNQKQQEHSQFQQQRALALKQAEDEFIPIGGALIAADLYVPNQDPAKLPKRVRVPYQALQWLIDKLDQQGASQGQLEDMNTQSITDLAQHLSQQQPQVQGSNQSIAPAGALGQASPQGVYQ